MPHLSLPTHSRRAFTISLAASGAALLRAAEGEMHWALFSDTHIAANADDSSRGFKPHDNLKAAVAMAVEAKPQGTLICGDIARQKGLAGDYEQVKSILEPVSKAMPVAMVLGNHDDRATFAAAFGPQRGAQEVKQKHVAVIESAAARFVILDSNVAPNSTPGFLGKAQRDWLGGYLEKASDLPTLLFVHHTLEDNDSALLDAPRLFDVVKNVKKVKAIVYGHSHRYGYEVWEGIHLINLPALGYNFSDSEPVGWVDSVVTKQGGSFTLRAIGGNKARDGKPVVLAWR